MTNESLTELFYLNPCPMWVFEIDTHKFLEVNDAACERYGYTREEFLQLTTLDIRPKSQQLKYHHAMKYALGSKSTGQTFVHMDKKGHEFLVKPLSFDLNYDGKKALAIQIIDVEDYNTERLRNKILSEKLKRELDFLKSFSFSQSHELRSRLANAKSMLILLQEKLSSGAESEEVIKIMNEELDQADAIIRKTVDSINDNLENR